MTTAAVKNTNVVRRGCNLIPYKTQCVRFEVLTVVLLKVQVFSDVTLCYWASGLDCFKDT